jgi:hypothetical protein
MFGGNFKAFKQQKNCGRILPNIPKISLYYLEKVMISLPLESELQVVRLKMYLDRNPQEASELALQHYEDFLALAIKYKKLQSKLEDIEACMLDFSESYGF